VLGGTVLTCAFRSVKMYNYRFDQWGVQKNFRSKQVQELLHQKAKRGAVGKTSRLCIGSQKVDEAKLATYLQRTSKKNKDRIAETALPGYLSPCVRGLGVGHLICRTPSPIVPPLQPYQEHYFRRERGSTRNEEDHIPNFSIQDNAESWISPYVRHYLILPTESPLSTLPPPCALKRAERFIFNLRAYVDEGCRSGRWIYYESSNKIDAHKRMVSWFSTMKQVNSLLASGELHLGFKLLQNCCAMYQQLLIDGSPVLFLYTYAIILKTNEVYPDIANQIMRYICGLLQILSRTPRPLHDLFHSIYNMDQSEIKVNAVQFSKTFAEFFQDKFYDTSDLLFNITAGNIDIQSTLAMNGTIEWGAVERTMQQEILIWKNRNIHDSLYVPDLMNRLSWQYYYQRKYQECQEIIDGLMQYENHEYKCSCYNMLSLINYKHGNFEEVIRICQIWMQTAIDGYGHSNVGTTTTLQRCSDLFRYVGQADMANETRKRLQVSIDEFCGKFEHLDIGNESTI